MELLDAAVGLGLVVVGRRAVDPEVVDLCLIVVAAKARAAVVAQRQSARDGALDRAEALHSGLAQQVGGGEPVHPRGGVGPGLAGGVVDDREDRAAPSRSVWPSVASVAHSVSGRCTVIVPSCRRRARRRTRAVGASSPASRHSRSTRLRLVRTPRRRKRAHSLR